MSNEYKEWHQDRNEEAWEAINKITELYERWRENGAGDGIIDIFLDVKNILEDGGWL